MGDQVIINAQAWWDGAEEGFLSWQSRVSLELTAKATVRSWKLLRDTCREVAGRSSPAKPENRHWIAVRCREGHFDS